MTPLQASHKQSLPRWRWKDVTISVSNCHLCEIAEMSCGSECGATPAGHKHGDRGGKRVIRGMEITWPVGSLQTAAR